MPASPSMRRSRPSGWAASTARRTAAKVALPADERQAAHRFGHRRRQGNGNRAPGSAGFAVAALLSDRRIQFRRLVKRRDAELAIEQRDERAILADGPGTIAGRREHLDEAPLAGFVERIDIDPPSGRLDGAGRIAIRQPGGREPIEELPDRSLDAHGACRLPVIEGGAVAQREAGEERTPSEPSRGLQVGPLGRCGKSLQLGQVHRRDGGIEAHPRPFDQEAVAIGGRGPEGR